MIDISVYVAFIVMSLALGILSLLGGRSIAWGTFAVLGGIIASYTALAIGQDGTLSSNGSGLVSAGTTLWNAVILTPAFLAGIDFMLAIIAVLRKLGARI